MSRPKEPNLVKLIISLITGDKGILKPVLKKLGDKFGSIDIISERLNFNHTDYYEKEMGAGLFRKLASFEKLIKPDSMSDIKLFTNSIENEYLTRGGKRIVNIDPGYISLEKMVLASHKNFSHRIYLNSGVYADLTLIYRFGAFQALEWTFPDYAEDNMRRLLKGVRERYVHQLQNGEPVDA
ncbi:MAG: DUF4416 family protein [Deltaproteobacteria bacterium]|nr:DUF4416 family protein [Deltaproteobacteria bacterium]MBI3754711.1 DUF4416 family protein [Deltaproteobacteria bacterium]